MLLTPLLRPGSLAVLLPLLPLGMALPAAGQALALVQGSVVEEHTLKPVPHGTITMTRENESPSREAEIRDGHFAIELPAGEGYRITIRAPGFHRFRSHTLTIFEAMPPLDFSVRRAHQVEGRVVDGRGNPVQAAHVSLFSNGELQESILTTPHGRFRFTLAAADGVHEVRVAHHQFDDAEPIEIGPPPNAPIRIVLAPRAVDREGRIRGVALGADGRVLAGATIHLVANTVEPFRSSTRTEPNGRFRFDAVRSGSYKLQFSHPAYSDSTGRSREVSVAPGEAVRVELRFEGSESLTGVVLDDRSQALAGALVMLQTITESPPQAGQLARLRRFYESTTDEEGLFAFRGVESGPYELVIRTLDRKFQERRVVVRVPEDDDLVLDLEPGHTLEALVFDDQRRPVTQFRLSVRAASGEGGSVAQHFELLDGPAAIGGLQLGEYLVTISLPDDTSFTGIVDLGRSASIALQIPDPGEPLIVHYLER